MDGPVAQFPIKKSSKKQRSGGPPPQIFEPLVISYYSVHDGPEGKYVVHDDALKYLRKLQIPRRPRYHYDLTRGYVPLSQNGPIIFGLRESRLNMLLQHLSESKDRIDFPRSELDERPIPFDFVTYRGVLAKLMMLPFEERNDILISAQKYKGTIYLAKFASLLQKQKEYDTTERRNTCAYGGLRFEQYITVPYQRDRKGQKNTKNLNYHDHFSCVAHNEIGGHSLLYSGEMDAITDGVPLDGFTVKDFVEIKTTQSGDTPRNIEYFEKNLLSWWTQCHLGGMRHLLCGYRDPDMVVRRVERFTPDQMKARGRRFWDHQVCLEFLDAMLSFIKQIMANVDDPNLIYEFHWQPGEEAVQVYLNNNPVEENDHKILFDWFFEKV